MNAEEHARAKIIFFSAIDLPKEERQSYVKQACSGDERLEQEVRSLLAHHRARTLLPKRDTTAVRSAQESVEATLGSRTKNKSSECLNQANLVLSDLWDENRELLRRRLQIFTAILGMVVGYSIVARAIQMTPVASMVSRIVCLTVDLICLFFLRRRGEPTLWQLRLLEVVITANVGSLMVVTDLVEMHMLSIEGNAVTITCANLWNYSIWSLLILTYGVFVPNTWQRAALLLLPIATIPYFVDLVNQQLYPVVAETLQREGFGLPLPLPFIAAGIAMSAAQVIHGARLSAFRARSLAQYELVRVIGSGGMGKVYEGRHVMLKRPCAIKVIQPDHSHDRNLLANFEQEARATSRLSHPHTIEVYDFGKTNEGLFFYVMELLPGINLRDLVEATGPLAPSRTIHFLLQICGALEEAHGLGLIHRDIKPANIFASERGGIHDFSKLLDFGLVRQTDSQFDNETARGNITAGTPAYMSPEQFVNYRNIDFRSDIYSLGAVAYFLLVGQPPFERDSYLDVLVAHAQEPVIPPISLKADIGSELNEIVLKCLEKSPEKRFSSAKQLKEALSACAIAHNWHQDDAVKWWKRHQANHTLERM